MKTFLAQKFWPVVAGLLVAFVIMMTFEYTNSLFYPLPTDLDIYDTEALRNFTATLPNTAYLLVLAGWAVGSLAGGCLTTRLAKETTYRLSLLVGVILTLMGIANNFMIGHALWVNVVGIPLFIIFSYLGHRLAK